MSDNCDTEIRPYATDDNDEAALLAAIQHSATSSFETLVDRYEWKIFCLAKRIVKNDCDAEDVTQEAFFKAFTHIKTFEGNSRFYTWLVRIVINQVLTTLRKRRPGHFSLDEPIGTEEHSFSRELEDWNPTPEARYSRDEFANALSSAVGNLHSTLRIVLQLRDVEDLSTDETASRLGISVSAVKSRLQRARQSLREQLHPLVRAGGGLRRDSVTSQREVM
jgi:RNA polymerase sigma-70 factor (ECF subfamily)